MSTPANGTVIRIADISSELLSIFSRRRELLIRTAFLIAAAAFLEELLVSDAPAPFPDMKADTIVAWFVAGATIVFCLRFIQLHAGLIFNALRFTVIEHAHFGGDLRAMLARTSKLNVTGLSAQIVIYLAILSGLSLGTALLQHGFSGWTAALSGALIGVVLLCRAASAHLSIVNGIDGEWLKTAPTIESSAAELRRHYHASMATAHLEMLAISTVLASLTFATLKLASQFLGRGPMGHEWARTFAFCGFSVVLSVITLRIYARLRSGIVNCCAILNLSYSRPFPLSISDSTLGFVVLASLAAANVANLFNLFLHRLEIQIGYRWFLAGAIVLIMALVVWHNWAIGKLRKRAAFMGPDNPAIWSESTRPKK